MILRLKSLLFSASFISLMIACTSNPTASGTDKAEESKAEAPNTTTFFGETVQSKPVPSMDKLEAKAENNLHAIEEEIQAFAKMKNPHETLAFRSESGDCYVALKHLASGVDSIFKRNQVICGEYGFTHGKYVIWNEEIVMGDKLSQENLMQSPPGYLIEQWLFDFRESGDSIQYYYRKKTTQNYLDTLFGTEYVFDTLLNSRKKLIDMAKEDWVQDIL